MKKLTPLEAASYQCAWCKQQGQPAWESGRDRVGGWTSGWTHRAKDGLVPCAAQELWNDAKDAA